MTSYQAALELQMFRCDIYHKSLGIYIFNITKLNHVNMIFRSGQPLSLGINNWLQASLAVGVGVGVGGVDC